MAEMMALVTGGSGFIGRNIVRECRGRGWKTISIDLSEKDSGADDSFVMSVTDFDSLNEIMRGVDFVFHEAAVTSPPQFDINGALSFNINISGTANVLQTAANNRVKRVIIASSSSVYGNLSIPGMEDMKLPEYGNLYPLSKKMGEDLALYYTMKGEVDAISLRYFNAYGAGENTKGAYSSVISKFMDDITNNRTPLIYGDGEQRRDFIYVGDIARANANAALYGKPGEAYNVGTGISLSFNEIYRIIKEVMSSNLDSEYAPVPFKSYQYFTQADTRKAERELGFKASFSLVDGIKETISQYA